MEVKALWLWMALKDHSGRRRTAAQAASATASAIEMFRRQAETGSSSSRSTDWFKLLPKPNVFDPRDYEQEVAMWREWWWSVTQYLCTLDSKYESELKYIETHADVNQDPALMNEDEKKRSMFGMATSWTPSHSLAGDSCKQWL